MSIYFRYRKYLGMCCKGILEPEKMPPTERAAYYHALRVHLQIITWKLLDDEFQLQPEEWGWKRDGNNLTPITTDMDVAPESLLKVIRCKCKSSSRNQCGSNLCTCRRHGVKCLQTCGECRNDCLNKKVHVITVYFSPHL